VRRRFIAPLALVAILAGVLVLAASASAAIDSVTGQVQLIAPPAGVLFPPHPGDACPVAGACLASDTTMFAFDEQQCVRAPNGLPVDITQPGTYMDSIDLTNGGVIPTGTLVSSHFVQSEQATPNSGGGAIQFDATVHTNAAILGIAILAHALDNTDVLGAPGTLYPTGTFGRALNLDSQNDFVIEFIDRQTVEVHSQVNLHADQVRIITACAGAGGLTPGYWKNHTSAWNGYTTSQTFDSVFNVTAFPSSLTLLQTLQQGGGGVNALGRQAVAALLNSTTPSLNYPISTAQVIQLVHDAIVSGNAATIQNLKNQLEIYNSLSG
jgi:hypothetical protein